MFYIEDGQVWDLHLLNSVQGHVCVYLKPETALFPFRRHEWLRYGQGTAALVFRLHNGPKVKGETTLRRLCRISRRWRLQRQRGVIWCGNDLFLFRLLSCLVHHIFGSLLANSGRFRLLHCQAIREGLAGKVDNYEDRALWRGKGREVHSFSNTGKGSEPRCNAYMEPILQSCSTAVCRESGIWRHDAILCSLLL